MTPERYRNRAIYIAAFYHAKPITMGLRCVGGCNKQITASVPEFVGCGPSAQRKLADRALRDGWEIDYHGDLACKECSARIGIGPGKGEDS